MCQAGHAVAPAAPPAPCRCPLFTAAHPVPRKSHRHLQKTVWMIKTDNYCSSASAAWSPGCVMTVIDFSVRDVLYRHCLYFSSVPLVQPPSSSTVHVSAGCGCNAPAPHCFPFPTFHPSVPISIAIRPVAHPSAWPCGPASAPQQHSSFSSSASGQRSPPGTTLSKL